MRAIRRNAGRLRTRAHTDPAIGVLRVACARARGLGGRERREAEGRGRMARIAGRGDAGVEDEDE